ncbi:MAG: ABC transporter substrate-binding protein [Acetobacteraceae bacterium]|nr:ABC transporter substrate-binding protein [Acetobacteraceae bacterium]
MLGVGGGSRGRPRPLGAAALAVLVLVLAFGCTPAPKGGAVKPVRIGTPLPITGGEAAFGQMLERGYRLAVDEINASGGVDGVPLELVVADHEGKPPLAMSAAERLITVEQVLALVGGHSSAVSYPIAQVAQQHKVPYVVDVPGADKITQQGWEWVFRINPTSTYYNVGLQDFLEAVVKPRRAAILFENTLFGTQTADAMKAWFASRGVEVVVFEPYEAGSLDFKPMLARLVAEPPDVVFMVSYLTDAVLIMRQCRELGVNPRLFAGAAAGFSLPQFPEQAGPAAELCYVSAPWLATARFPGATRFVERFKGKYGVEPTHHAAAGYSAIKVVADALDRAGRADREALRQALLATRMDTVFGPVRFENFEKYRNQNRLQTVVLQVRNGAYEVIWPPEAATAEPLFPDPLAGGD